MWLLLASACVGPATPSRTTLPPAGACALAADNALRAVCTITRADPGPVEVELTDGEERALFTDDARTVEHVVPVWGLTPETTWSYAIRADGTSIGGGEITTGALPPPVDLLIDADVLAPDTEIEMILAPLACGEEPWAVVLDPDGQIRWYQSVQRDPADPRLVKAMTWGDDDQVLALVGPAQIASYDLAGTETQRVFAPHEVHHDVFRADGVTYALMADRYVEDDGEEYVEDLIGGFDATGEQVFEFETFGNLGVEPTAGPPSDFWAASFPGAIDAWHANGLFVTAEQDVLLSMKRVNAIAKISGGSVAWSLVGTPAAAYFPSDFALVPAGEGDPAFAEQHDPWIQPGGHLTLFDNHAPRGLELALDEEVGTATFVRDWPVNGPCPWEGSVYPMSGGHWLATCATSHVFWEFDEAGAVARRIVPRCESGSLPIQTMRGVPIDLWDAHVGTVRSARLD